MAWEWLAPAAAIAGTLAGGGITGLVARGTRKHTEKMARQERQQKRLQEAYLETLTIINKAGLWASQVRPPTGKSVNEAILPSRDEELRALVLMQMYGSPAVYELFLDHVTAVNRIRKADLMIGRRLSSDGAHLKPDYQEIWDDLEDNLRPAELTKREALVKRINAELGG
jgi:hypothetical protein